MPNAGNQSQFRTSHQKYWGVEEKSSVGVLSLKCNEEWTHSAAMKGLLWLHTTSVDLGSTVEYEIPHWDISSTVTSHSLEMFKWELCYNLYSRYISYIDICH